MTLVILGISGLDKKGGQRDHYRYDTVATRLYWIMAPLDFDNEVDWQTRDGRRIELNEGGVNELGNRLVNRSNK